MVRLAVLAIALAACAKKAAPPTAEGPCSKAVAEGPLAWIRDDYTAAVACAKQKKLPIVIDLWAPWCHTCLSMQTTVFTDPSFAADQPRFVFLSLDTDRETNAAALTKLSISAWPTFYVLGPDEQVLARFVGAASIAQFHELLDSGTRAQAGGQAAADAHLLGAERALALKELTTAEEELGAALAAAPQTWKRRPEALNSLILTKLKRKDLDGCLDVADTYLAQTGNTATASDFLVSAMSCAETKAKDAPDRVAALRDKAIARWRELLADATAPLSVDDRSDALASLREALDTVGKKDDAKAIAEQQRTLLDDAAAKAPTPLVAMTYNWPRAEVYVYLGRPLDLVPALEKSAHDLPGEYDPRARLASLLLKAGKYDDAARWADATLELIYGPRKGRILTLRADIAKAAGDHASELRFRNQAVQLYESLPPSQQQPDALAAAKTALQATVAENH